MSIEDAVPAGALPAGGGVAASQLVDESLPPPAPAGAPIPLAGTAPEAAVVETRSGALTEPPPDIAAPVARVDGVGASAPRATGQFPNLNLPPRSATSQFTPAESRAKANELRGAATQVQRTADGISSDKKELERLKKLGESHGKDALKAIEKR